MKHHCHSISSDNKQTLSTNQVCVGMSYFNINFLAKKKICEANWPIKLQIIFFQMERAKETFHFTNEDIDLKRNKINTIKSAKHNALHCLKTENGRHLFSTFVTHALL